MNYELKKKDWDVEALRREFPILRRRVHGKPLVYLDNAATTQKPRAVIEALQEYYQFYNANIHRGIHELSEEATQLYEGTRQKMAQLIHASRPDEMVFTRNTTEAINLIVQAWGRKFLKEGDEILLSEMEHHSNLVPWHFLAREKNVKLRFIPVTREGTLDLGALDTLITARTKVVSLVYMSNVLGTVNPLEEIFKKARAVKALCIVDAAQAVPHIPVDVRELDCDFLAFSVHKMMGPTGVGVLYGKMNRLEEMDPFLGGGSMIQEVWLDHSTYERPPQKFEAGTPNIAGVSACSAALDFIQQVCGGMEKIWRYEQELTSYALEKLKHRTDVIVYGPGDMGRRGGMISFNYRGVHPHDVGTILDQEGVAIRAGHHCCQPLMRKLGIEGTARMSFYVYNTREEIDLFLRSLDKVGEIFKTQESQPCPVTHRECTFPAHVKEAADLPRREDDSPKKS